MHYSEIRDRNFLEGFWKSHDDGNIKFWVEDVPPVNNIIVGPWSLQGGGETLLGQGHEYHDQHYGGRDTAIYWD